MAPRTLARDFTPDLARIVETFSDTVEVNERLFADFTARVDAHPELRRHRDFVEAHGHGYGERAFHWLWHLLVEQMGPAFSFLEIGVYKGQAISLIRLLANQQGKAARIVGVTPLSSAGDRHSRHDEVDYLAAIEGIHRAFTLDMRTTTLIKGLSQERRVLELAFAQAPYDMLLVDGCHDAEVVANDLMLYPTMLAHGGFLVVDDSALFSNLPDGMFKGLLDVSVATREIIENDAGFRFLFGCGHNRVWQKVGDQGRPNRR